MANGMASAPAIRRDGGRRRHHSAGGHHHGIDRSMCPRRTTSMTARCDDAEEGGDLELLQEIIEREKVSRVQSAPRRRTTMQQVLRGAACRSCRSCSSSI